MNRRATVGALAVLLLGVPALASCSRDGDATPAPSSSVKALPTTPSNSSTKTSSPTTAAKKTPASRPSTATAVPDDEASPTADPNEQFYTGSMPWTAREVTKAMNAHSYKDESLDAPRAGLRKYVTTKFWNHIGGPAIGSDTSVSTELAWDRFQQNKTVITVDILSAKQNATALAAGESLVDVTFRTRQTNGDMPGMTNEERSVTYRMVKESGVWKVDETIG